MVSLTVKATYQACDDKVCLAPVRDQSFPITISIVSPGQAPPETSIDQAIFADFPEHVFGGLDRGPEPDDRSSTNSTRYVMGGIIGVVVGIAGVFVLVKVLRR